MRLSCIFSPGNASPLKYDFPDQQSILHTEMRELYSGRATCEFRRMKELVRTNDAVLISFIEALMRDAGIAYLVADQNMSVLDGSLGILPRRVLVDEDEIVRARSILADAGIGNEIEKR